MFLRN